MPVLKADPRTGESLDKAKTPEQVAAEEEARVKALAEFKERVKLKKPRKKKEVVTEEVLVAADKEAPVIVVKKIDIPVKVNPFEAPNGEVNAEELIEPLNAIIKDVEHSLQLITKGYKLDNKGTDMFSKLSLPKSFEYKSSVTRVSSGAEAFNLVKPSGVTKLTYQEFQKDVYVDRVFLKPVDVKELLKDKDKATELMKNLIIDGMWQNLWNTKGLDSKKKYFGTEVARIKLPGVKDQYCFHNTTYDEAMIEIRMYSDITELPKGK